MDANVVRYQDHLKYLADTANSCIVDERTLALNWRDCVPVALPVVQDVVEDLARHDVMRPLQADDSITVMRPLQADDSITGLCTSIDENFIVPVNTHYVLMPKLEALQGDAEARNLQEETVEAITTSEDDLAQALLVHRNF